MMNEECVNCEWYNKPYWSIISPCTNCTKRFNKKSVTVKQYSINIDKKELYKEIEDLKQRIDKGIKFLDKVREENGNEIGQVNYETLIEILGGKE